MPESAAEEDRLKNETAEETNVTIYCPNCGALLSADAKFCNRCGNAVDASQVREAAAPGESPARPAAPPAQPSAAACCTACGKPLNPGAKFCNRCGTPVAVPSGKGEAVRPAPAAAQAAPPPVRPSVPAAPAIAKSAAPAEKKEEPKKRRGLKPLIAAVLVVALAVTGFIKPGFFLPKKEKRDPWANIHSTAVPGGSTAAARPEATARPNASSAPLRTAGVVGIGSIGVRYSDAEIAAAPAKEAAVSPSAPVAVCGDVTVDFGSWQLNGEDTLVVRDLQDKLDEASGFRVKAYDFSLASGQNEFTEDVVITIPRTAGENALSYCAAYNEETGAWEYVYSEPGEDGKTYAIYTNHFCQKAEIVVEGEVLNDESFFRRVSESTALFEDNLYICPSDRSRVNKDLPVYVDFCRLMRDLKNCDAFEMAELEKIVKRCQANELAAALPYADLIGFAKTAVNHSDGFLSAMAVTDKGTLAAGILEKSGKLHQLMEKTPVKGLSAILALNGIYSAYSKTKKELDNGHDYLSSISNCETVGGAAAVLSLSGAALEAWAAATGTATAAAGPIGTAGAVLGFGVYLYATWYRQEPAKTYERPEALYRSFYVNGDSHRTFYFDVEANEADMNANIGFMKSLPSLTDDENRILKAFINGDDKPFREVNWHGFDELNRYTRWLDRVNARFRKGLVGYAPTGGNSPGAKWREVLEVLYDLCLHSQKPEKLDAVIREFYESYARAAYSMGGSLYRTYAEQQLGADIDSVDYYPDIDTRSKYIENLVRDMWAYQRLDHKTIQQNYEREAEEEQIKLLEKTLVPFLNTKLEFYVLDTSLDDPAELSMSVYGVDYSKIPGNGSVIDNFDKIPSPMHFAVKSEDGYRLVQKPLITLWMNYQTLSGRERYHPVPADAYYPHTNNFLPRAQAGTNLVFSCPMYFYLMMGAPDAMMFTDLNDPDAADKPVDFTVPLAADSDGVIRVNIEVDGRSGPDFSGFIGTWVGDYDEYSYGETYLWRQKLDIAWGEKGKLVISLYNVDEIDGEEFLVTRLSPGVSSDGRKNYTFSGSTLTFLNFDPDITFDYLCRFSLGGGTITMTEPCWHWVSDWKLDHDEGDFEPAEKKHVFYKQ